MKEFKILAVVAFFTLVTYWGVEPFAHSQMHKEVESNNFVYDGKADIEEANNAIEVAKNITDAKKKATVLDAANKKLVAKKAFWAEVSQISKLQGNAVAGEASFALCMACHNGSGVNMGGVVPPKLDNAGSLYDKNYLIALLKDPAMASNVDHKYADTMMHPMGTIKTMITTPQQIADVVAFIKTKKVAKLTPEVAFEDACGRCHANRYGNLTQLGATPKFKTEQEALAHRVKVLDEQDRIKAYMGKLPPDLSIMSRARSEIYMETFIQNPQSQLPNTSMPRVGLTSEGYGMVKAYLEKTGDPSKDARHALGPWVIVFFIIFTMLAYLWKKSQWKDLH
ncbi:MAG: c-type cytochrome [Sulfurovaceae bacterium]|nr:c-type cytochrome [Sulfurovaceae bacterium]